MPNTKMAWVEGVCESQNIVHKLADEICNATLPAGEINTWIKVFEEPSALWTEYAENFRDNVQGRYRHTDGKLYTVRKILENIPSTIVFTDGRVYEVRDTTSGIRTGRSVYVRTFTYTTSSGDEIALSLPGLLIVVIPDLSSPTGTRCFAVEQKRQNLNGTVSADENWNEFVLGVQLPDEWIYFGSGLNVLVDRNDSPHAASATLAPTYLFRERFYTASVHTFPTTSVLKNSITPPQGKQPKDFFALLSAVQGQFNYLSLSMGEGFHDAVFAIGNPALTYVGICDPTTVRAGVTPTVIDQLRAEQLYLSQNSVMHPYTPPSYKWAKDFDGVTDLVSPLAHFFYGNTSTLAWLANKQRRPTWEVYYWLSITNEAVSIIIEGDPSPDHDGYYRSFGYIGALKSFNAQDYEGNFAITAGMGDLDVPRTGFTVDNIRQDRAPLYSGWGRYTSNGMNSISMLRTRGNVFFQAHYPAFLTQLPNYSGVGTLPQGLQRMVLDETGFQPSLWSEKYHASPIYVYHQNEGYRGYLQGVVAINNHNLVNLDELLVDTEELKDPLNPTAGTWTEVYKFFSLRSPVNLFKQSANPDEMTVAILKEIR